MMTLESKLDARLERLHLRGAKITIYNAPKHFWFCEIRFSEEAIFEGRHPSRVQAKLECLLNYDASRVRSVA